MMLTKCLYMMILRLHKHATYLVMVWSAFRHHRRRSLLLLPVSIPSCMAICNIIQVGFLPQCTLQAYWVPSDRHRGVPSGCCCQ